MQVDSSKSNDLKFGTKATSWKDIGVDLCAKNKGWRWAICQRDGMEFRFDDTVVLNPEGKMTVDWNSRWVSRPVCESLELLHFYD